MRRRWYTVLSYWPWAKCRCSYYDPTFGHNTMCPRRRRRDGPIRREWGME